MASAAKKQDMPPPGGYRSIPYARIPAKQFFSGFSMIAGYVAVSTGALYLYYLNYKKIERLNVEMRSASLAIQPLLEAEQDREFLKQLRRNRDEEAALMANVPNWEVGTYYGERIFKTSPPDTLHPISHQEYYVHAPFSETAKRVNIALWS